MIVHLGTLPLHFFVIVVAENTFKFAIVAGSLVTENGLTVVGIDHLAWLDAAKLGFTGDQELSTDTIRKLYTYSLYVVFRYPAMY